jgi:hypothetical protein
MNRLTSAIPVAHLVTDDRDEPHEHDAREGKQVEPADDAGDVGSRGEQPGIWASLAWARDCVRRSSGPAVKKAKSRPAAGVAQGARS